MRRLPILLLLLLLALPGITPAQTAHGVFALVGFSNPELVYLDLTGEYHEFGPVAPTATALRIHQDNLYIVNGDDWGTQTGGGLWIAELTDLADYVNFGTPFDWTVVDLPDGTNPYDLAGYEQYVYVTLQTGNGVIKLDSEDSYAQVASADGIGMPQGIAVSGTIVCVAESNLGNGQNAYFMDLDLNSPYAIPVGTNPQQITVDASGNFHIICTGNYGDITGEAWKIDPTWNEPHTTSLALGGTPSTLTIMSDGEGNEKVVVGDEYAANPPYLYGYDPDEMTLDETTPNYRSGGWSLAGGNSGVYIGSAISNSVYFLGYDWSGYESLHTFDAAVASLVYFDMPLLTVDEPYAVVPATFTLSHAWPNPFNASTSIALTLDRPQHAMVSVYDILGRQAATILNQSLIAGTHRLQIEGHSLASGRYLVVARADNRTVSQPITLVR
ncbi:T9SS type A sorting domain-containing protein [bacterium]|nr:T9SS type A sorting domain-containing protein [bacterium]